MELDVDMKAVKLCELADASVKDVNWMGLSEGVNARTCVVAGVLDDGEESCRERGKQLKVGNPESRAFKVEKRHGCDIQDPDLFVRGIKYWMEGSEMPKEYVSPD